MSKKRNRRGRRAGILPEVAVPSRGVPRRLRVERDLQEQLVMALRGLRDDRVNRAIITRVELTDDLAFARIYVRPPIDKPVEPKALVKTLKLASGRLRRQVGKGMALRKAPELRFIHDGGPEAAERVEELLAEIRADRASSEGESELEANGEAVSADGGGVAGVDDGEHDPEHEGGSPHRE